MSDVPAAPAGQEEGASSNIFQGSATVASVEKEEGLISEVQNWTGGEQDSFSSGGVSGHLLVLVFLVVLDVVTVCGNFLIIAAVVSTPKLRTVTNYFILSLAVADFLVGICVLPPAIMLHTTQGTWLLGWVLCDAWITFDILLCTASILSLAAISIDRFLAISRPIKYSKMRRSKALAAKIIGAVWVGSAFISSPPILGWSENNRRDKERICTYNENLGYVIYSSCGSFYVPLLVILYTYARIILVVRRRNIEFEQEKGVFGGVLGVGKAVSASAAAGAFGAVAAAAAAAAKEEEHTVSRSEFEMSEVIERRHCVVASTPSGGREESSGDSGGGAGSRGGSSRGARAMMLLKKTTATSFLGSRFSKRKKLGNGSCGRAGEGRDGKGVATGNGRAIPVVESSAEKKHLPTSNGQVPFASMAVSPKDDEKSSFIGSACSNGGNGVNWHFIDLSSVLPQPQQQQHQQQQMPPVEEKADKKSPVPSIKGEKTSDTGVTKKCPVCPVCGNAGGNNTALHVSYVEEGSIDSSGGGGTVAAGGHATNSRRCSSSNSNNSDASSGRAVLRMERERSEEDEEEEDLEEDNNSKKRRRKRRRMLRRKGEAADDDDGASSSSGPASLIRPFLFLPLVATANKRRSEKRRRKAEEEARASRWPHRRRRRSSLISEDSQRHQVRLHLRGFTTNSSGTPATPGGGGGGGGSLSAAGASSSRLSTSHRRMHQRETRTAMRLAVVVCFFITCWLPFFLLYILKPVLPEESFPYVAYSFLTWLGWINSAVNPFLYASYSPKFREAFYRITLGKGRPLCCARGGGSGGEGQKKSRRRKRNENNVSGRGGTTVQAEKRAAL